jgi:hypothetical protein
MKHETLLEQHSLLQHELTHAKTVAEAAAEGAKYYRAQLDESTFRQQAAEGHVVQLQQTISKLQRDASAEKSLLLSLQSVCITHTLFMLYVASLSTQSSFSIARCCCMQAMNLVVFAA